jgi:D-glycero-D-manno-heptose 1,7-bisphosphate phosphatase
MQRAGTPPAIGNATAAFKLSPVVTFTSDSVAATRPQKLIVLDRDGVINHDSDAFIKSPDEWVPIPGSLDAIARLNQAGFRVVVATNQSGIGRGLFDIGTLNAIHNKMHRALAQAGGRIDAVFFCPHSADSQCECRKPRPGMLQEIGRRFGVDLTGVPALGDGLRDLQAAASVGAQPMLVLTGKGEKTLRDGGLPDATLIFPDLAFAAASLVSGERAN